VQVWVLVGPGRGSMTGHGWAEHLTVSVIEVVTPPMVLRSNYEIPDGNGSTAIARRCAPVVPAKVVKEWRHEVSSKLQLPPQSPEGSTK